MKSKILILASLIGGHTLAQGVDVPRPTTGYSGKQQIRMGSFQIEMDLAYENGKQRTTMNMMGQNLYTILRPDLGVVWVGMPNGMYTETAIGEDAEIPGQGERVPSFNEFENVVELVREGSEVMNGHESIRYRFVTNDPASGNVDGTAWLTVAHNIPVRFEMETVANGQPVQVQANLLGLQTGDQNDSLFELPTGAQKFNMGGGFFGGGGGAGPFGGFGNASPPATSSTAPATAAATAEEQESSLTEQMGDAVAEGASDAAVQEAENVAGDIVRGSFRRFRDRLRGD